MTETVYSLSSQRLPADTYMTFIRGHWASENRLHWVKDVTFDEDYPSRAGGHALRQLGDFVYLERHFGKASEYSDCSSSSAFVG